MEGNNLFAFENILEKKLFPATLLSNHRNIKKISKIVKIP